MYKRVAIKIGSNVLTRPDGGLDVTRISSIADQLADLLGAGIEVVVVSSGAVASGRSEITLRSNLDDISARQIYSSVGQVKLMNKYYDLLKDHSITCGQVLTTKDNFADRRRYLNQKSCIEGMLLSGILPIINENDAVSVTELMFTDNDELSGLIATMIGAEVLVILSNVDGIYDGDPSDPASKVVPVIYPEKNSRLEKGLKPVRSSFGRGGIITKYRIARKIAAEGVEVIIANGTRAEILRDLLINGDNGVAATRFVAQEKTSSSVKRWISHSDSFAKGELHIDENALRALSSGTATSLLPVGVVRVVGEFEKNDIVKVIGPGGRAAGVGKVAYGSADAAAMVGVKGGRPLIHYDYLCLTRESQP